MLNLPAHDVYFTFDRNWDVRVNNYRARGVDDLVGQGKKPNLKILTPQKLVSPKEINPGNKKKIAERKQPICVRDRQNFSIPPALLEYKLRELT